jgi:hypothetical protein
MIILIINKNSPLLGIILIRITNNDDYWLLLIINNQE